MNGPSLNDIINQIKNWQIEVHSDRNDGWTRAHYMILLNKVISLLAMVRPTIHRQLLHQIYSQQQVLLLKTIIAMVGLQ